MNATQGTAPKTTTRACTCGCGASTSSSRTLYRPGHDARHISQLLVNVRTELKHLGQAVKATDEGLKALPSKKLKYKFLVAAHRAEDKHNGVSKLKKPADYRTKVQAVEAITEADGEDADQFLTIHDDQESQALSKIKGEPVEAMWDEDQDTIEEAFPVKIGRWTYPARFFNGEQQRNTKRDGSGEWIQYEG